MNSLKGEYQNKLTVVIPFKNENPLFVIQTVESILETSNNRVKVILVNDNDPYVHQQIADQFENTRNVMYVRCKADKGVSGARMIGASLVETPYLLTFDAHMLMADNDWDIPVIGFLSEENHKNDIYFGGSMYLKISNEQKLKPLHTNKSTSIGCKAEISKETDTDLFKLYEPKWMYDNRNHEGKTHKDIYTEPIPCPMLMGACYAMSKSHWDNIHGVNGLSKYGWEETMLSLKTWRVGGQCYVDNRWGCYHLYRDNNPTYIPQEFMFFNHMLCIILTCDDVLYERVLTAYKNSGDTTKMKALEMIGLQLRYILEERKYLETIYTRDLKDFDIFNQECIEKFEKIGNK
jgi:glycosyltransferase involved in cell wall biosynthesis